MPSRRLGAAAGLCLLVALGGCGGAGRAHAGATTAPTTSTSTSTTTTTTVPATTTTTTLPLEPQPSPDEAASVFIDGWESGDRGESARVAVPAAVATLFASPYAGQTVIDRGCTTTFTPIVCSFGPYGGGSGALYEITVVPLGNDYYVRGVTIEG